MPLDEYTAYLLHLIAETLVQQGSLFVYYILVDALLVVPAVLALHQAKGHTVRVLEHVLDAVVFVEELLVLLSELLFVQVLVYLVDLEVPELQIKGVG